jgi:hypothetical protein
LRHMLTPSPERIKRKWRFFAPVAKGRNSPSYFDLIFYHRKIGRLPKMPIIKPDRHELFAQGLAVGLTQEKAYAEAGYRPNRGGASRLADNVNIINRVAELQARKVDRLVLTKQYILDAAIENLEKALARKPIKTTDGDKESEVYVYKPEAANAALKMLGAELNLFTDRQDVRITTNYDHMSDEELARRMQESVRLILEAPKVIDHDDDTP